MSSGEAWIQDLSKVAHGGRVEVWDEDNLLCVGTVDQVDPDHAVVWILEDGIGERKMIHTQQRHLRYCSTSCSH